MCEDASENRRHRTCEVRRPARGADKLVKYTKVRRQGGRNSRTISPQIQVVQRDHQMNAENRSVNENVVQNGEIFLRL